MIYTITLNPYIEKIIHGKNKDEIEYEMKQTTYHVGGVGLRTSIFLKEENIENTACYICGNNVTSYIKDDLLTVPSICMETGKEDKILTSMYDEDTILDKEDNISSINSSSLLLFQSIISNTFNQEDVIIFEYPEIDIEKSYMQQFLSMLRKESEVVLLSIDPTYYECIDEKCNVLVLDEKTYLKYRGFDKSVPLSGTLAYIQEHFIDKTKIFVYALNNHDMVLFFDGQIYRASADITEDVDFVYKEAIFTGLVKCFLEDGDLQTLVNHCLAMSIGTSLSDGLIKPLIETQSMIKKKVELRKI